jgi:hydrogenase-4 component A
MNRFVIADSSRCVACFACQAACVENHLRVGLQAYPRLTVTYTPEGYMPLQCRQCDKPPCMTVCPVNAIGLRNGSVVLNETICIGCKMCGLACPFGVILPGGTPVPVYGFNMGQYSYANDPYHAGPMHLRELDQPNFLSLLTWHIGQKKVAVKCDLCFFDPDGPACVRACPHKALSLSDPQSEEEVDRGWRIKTPAPVGGEAAPEVLLEQEGGD